MTYRIGSLFSGYGGLDLAVAEVLDAEVAWHCENDPSAVAVLAAHWPDVPNLGDITTVDWPTTEPVDVLTGGFPCQDVSLAGPRRGLRAGTRSGLWHHMHRAITELRPSLVVIENVRGLFSAEADGELERCPWCMGDGEAVVLRALGAVLGDLAGLRYDAVWCGLPASAVGAPHGRFRVFIAAADTDDLGPIRSRAPRDERSGPAYHSGTPADTSGDGRDEGRPEPARLVGGPDVAERGASAADANGERLEGCRPVGPQAAGGRRLVNTGGTFAADAEGIGYGHSGAQGGQGLSAATVASPPRESVHWGQFEPAIRRWEAVLGRTAPVPTVLSERCRRRVARRRAGKDKRPVGMRGSLRPVRVLNPALPEWMMGLPEGWVTEVPGLSRNNQLKVLGNGVVPQQAAAALRHLLSREVWEAAA